SRRSAHCPLGVACTKTAGTIDALEHPKRNGRAIARVPEPTATSGKSQVSSLEQLQPLITPPPVGFWPPAPGWWLLLILLPLIGFGLWTLRRFLPKKRPVARAEQPLDPVRLAALAEL